MAATWPEETIHSKVVTVGLDPHGKVPDPWIIGVHSGRPARPKPEKARIV
jgi:hypothetical protein